MRSFSAPAPSRRCCATPSLTPARLVQRASARGGGAQLPVRGAPSRHPRCRRTLRHIPTQRTPALQLQVFCLIMGMMSIIIIVACTFRFEKHCN